MELLTVDHITVEARKRDSKVIQSGENAGKTYNINGDAMCRRILEWPRDSLELLRTLRVACSNCNSSAGREPRPTSGKLPECPYRWDQQDGRFGHSVCMNCRICHVVLARMSDTSGAGICDACDRGWKKISWAAAKTGQTVWLLQSRLTNTDADIVVGGDRIQADAPFTVVDKAGQRLGPYTMSDIKLATFKAAGKFVVVDAEERRLQTIDPFDKLGDIFQHCSEDLLVDERWANIETMMDRWNRILEIAEKSRKATEKPNRGCMDWRVAKAIVSLGADDAGHFVKDALLWQPLRHIGRVDPVNVALAVKAYLKEDWAVNELSKLPNSLEE